MTTNLLTDTNLLKSLETEIHVWFCHPDEITDEVILDDYLSILSNEESEKYQRFHFEKDSHSYLVSHALVRKVLSRYCDVRPESWGFNYNQHGKPEISSDIECPNLKFNLSHTDGLSACVVSLDNDCGVDVESIQRKNKLRAVAERMFAAEEIKTMSACDETEIRKKFFDFWTLREAYVKALGTGLAGSSRDFYFTIDEQGVGAREADIHFVSADEKITSIWQFLLLNLSDQYVTAVSVKSESGIKKKIVSHKITP